MSHTSQPPDPAQSVPPLVRTIAYYTMLIASVVGGAVAGIVAIVAPDSAVTVSAVVGVVLSAVGMLAGGVGVAYRPTAGIKP